MAKHSKPEKVGFNLDMLSFITRLFGKKKPAQTFDALIDAMLAKNFKTVCQLQRQVENLDLFCFPASAKATKYRWECLIRDLLDHSGNLKLLQHTVRGGQSQSALNRLTFEMWPLTLKIACRYETETGKQGDWIQDMSALYVMCEKTYTAEKLAFAREPRVAADSKIVALKRVDTNEENFDNDKPS